jgi:hypothetical protein
MTPRTLLTRRRFLAAAGGLVGAVAVVRSRPWASLVRIVPRSDAERLVALFGHPESARAIGRAYLEGDARRRSVREMVREVVDDLPDGRDTLRSSSDDVLRDILARRIQGDFGDGRVVFVQGWMLSRTEADLYALAALT